MSLPKNIMIKYRRGLNLTDEQFRDVIRQIIKLNPKPGGHVGETVKRKVMWYRTFLFLIIMGHWS